MNGVTPTSAELRLHVSPSPALFDDAIAIKASGANPDALISIEVRMNDDLGQTWSAEAEFRADSEGVVDVSRAPAVTGAYEGVDSMGLFWCASAHSPSLDQPAHPVFLQTSASLRPLDVTVTARAPGLTPVSRTIDRRFLAAGVERRDLRRTLEGVDASVFIPVERPRFAVLVVGGSGGGNSYAIQTAALLASRGAASMAICYFDPAGECGVSHELADIPLEYFDRAIECLRLRVPTDTALGIVGVSKGAEVALLLGTRRTDIAQIAAVAPSSHVWQAIRFGDQPVTSSWRIGDAPVPYIAYPAGTLFSYDGPPPNLRALHDQSRREATETARTPIERISARVALFAGTADGTWDAAGMAREMMQRHGSAAGWRYREFEGAGHAIYFPHVPAIRLPWLHDGAADLNAAASVATWGDILGLFDLNLSASA